MTPVLPFEFHISRDARARCAFDGMLFATDGRIVLARPEQARRLAAALTQARGGSPVASAAELYAMGLLDEAMHLAIARYRADHDPAAIGDALPWFAARLGGEALDRTLLGFATEFPPLAVYRDGRPAAEWLAGSTGGVPHRVLAFEELVMLWLTSANPACGAYRDLFDDRVLLASTAYARLTALLREYFETRPRFGPGGANLLDFLRAPALARPDSLFAQLEFVREHWGWLLGALLDRVLVGLDVLREEQRWFAAREHARHFAARRHFGGDSGPGAVPRYGLGDVEYEGFSHDEEWMPRVVLMAKSTHVWLDQLAREYGREVRRLDQVPDEELDRLAAFGITCLWLIGLWERSPASQRIKQLCGNPDAAASAYSLRGYDIAWELGGEDAYRNLRDRAAARGLRLASDMVPNHMGLDSHWVLEHPEWFLQLPYSPYPAYAFNGPDLSDDPHVELKIEDHYYDRTDAAVVFRRVDRRSGDTRFLYHGNDGTSFPWNDTAQLDYLNPAVREQVIQTILAVARRFPVIRFDAAMTLARRHVQRLWYPEPGSGGGIPSRAEHGMSAEQFAQAMPNEFWREVVDRVAVEAPGTLLLAEAFWMMEGYFVRTLGMHRVYNSAFMNMLRDEQNANYRSVIKNTIEFDADILQRYVNFVNNPDERTAVDQFGRGEKYFGTCTLLATLPGLPMFGHGQIEGLEEKYGMEFRRAQRIEAPDEGMVAEHWRRIVPLLHHRALFSGSRAFRLYDCFTESGTVNEDVFAYSNRRGDDRALVLYHNRWAEARGWIRLSTAFADKVDGQRRLRRDGLAEALGLDEHRAPHVRCRDVVSGLEFLYRTRDLAHYGLHVELGGYGSRVLLDWREVQDDGRPWGELCYALEGRGVPSLDERMLEHELAPVQHALAAVPEALLLAAARAERATGEVPDPETVERRARQRREAFEQRVRELLAQARAFALGPSGRASGLGAAWTGDERAAIEEAGEAFAALLRVPDAAAPRAWAKDAEAAAVLPIVPLGLAAERDSGAVPWALAVTWLAARALGRAADAVDPQEAALRLFDALRLRRGVFDAFAWRNLGHSEEARWRAAAFVRAALAHTSWRAGGDTDAPAPWRDDHDVRWLIGAHEHEGRQWFRREPHLRFTWWRTLPALLAAAAKKKPLVRDFAALEAWIARERERAEATGWDFAKLAAEPAAAKRGAPARAGARRAARKKN